MVSCGYTSRELVYMRHTVLCRTPRFLDSLKLDNYLDSNVSLMIKDGIPKGCCHLPSLQAVRFLKEIELCWQDT